MILYLLKFVVFITPLYLVRFKIFGVPTTPLEISIYFLFLLWLFNCPKSLFKKKWKFLFPILLIFFGATLSTIFSKDIMASGGIWKAYFLDPLLFLLVFLSVADSTKYKNNLYEYINSILFYFLLSGYVVAIISIAYLFSGHLTYDGRLSAFYLSPNHLAMFLAPVLLINVYFLFSKNAFFGNYFGRYFLKKVVLSITGFLMGIVIFFTDSYGAWIGLVVALISYFIFLKIRKTPQHLKYTIVHFRCINRINIKLVSLLASGLILLGIMFVIFNLSPIADYFDATGRSSFHSRIMIWESSAKIINDNFVLGIGPGMFQDYYLEYQKYFSPYLEWAVPQPHNIFLAFWLQTGIIGLIGFIWLIYATMRKLLKYTIVHFRNDMVDHIVLLTISFFVYFIIHGLVDTLYWKNDLALIFWFFVGISMIIAKMNKSSDIIN